MNTTHQAPAGIPRRAWNGLTPFQREVYVAVSRIPRGQTRSYQWVAKAIGRPGAARAVGNALNGNPFAPRVPCHRVVRADGTLGGFAGGPARKRRLLLREGWTA
jgi:O-6-methylguanine DNA methyltransferase